MPTATATMTTTRVTTWTGSGEKPTLATRRAKRTNVQSLLPPPTPPPSGEAAAARAGREADPGAGATAADGGPPPAPRKRNAVEKTETADVGEMTAAAETMMIPIGTSTAEGRVVVVVVATIGVAETVARVSALPPTAQPTAAGARAPTEDDIRASAEVTAVQVAALNLTVVKTAAAVEKIAIDDGRAVTTKTAAKVAAMIIRAAAAGVAKESLQGRTPLLLPRMLTNAAGEVGEAHATFLDEKTWNNSPPPQRPVPSTIAVAAIITTARTPTRATIIGTGTPSVPSRTSARENGGVTVTAG